MKNKYDMTNNLLFVTENDYQCTLSQLYHENSKASKKKIELSSVGQNQNLINLCEIVNGKGKDYSFYESIDISLSDSFMTHRKSERNFTGEAISKEDMKLILNKLLAYRSPENYYRRQYPSAGALYPIEIYCLALNVDDCEKSLYYLDVYQQQLMRIKNSIDLKDIQNYFIDEAAVLKANLIILLTAVIPRLEIKYGQRAYRYAHLEAGHAAQVILDQCHHNQFAAFPVGGFIERDIEALLEIDGQEEIAIYSIIIGKK